MQRRYTRVNSQGGSLYGGPGPEYDDPANCAEEDQYGSQYGAPYDHYGSRRSVGKWQLLLRYIEIGHSAIIRLFSLCRRNLRLIVKHEKNGQNYFRKWYIIFSNNFGKIL